MWMGSNGKQPPTCVSAGQRLFCFVREGGFEPPRPFGHWHLKPARLPFRHSRAPEKISTQRGGGRNATGVGGPRIRSRPTNRGRAVRKRATSPTRQAYPRRRGGEGGGAMGILDKFEHGVERAVNNAFAKAFRSELKPVELASALRREVDDRAAVVDRDRTVVPNDRS